MTTSNTQIAVIGAGAMGRNHIRIISEEPEAQLVAISDVMEAGRGIADQHAVPFFLDAVDMMEEVKPEAVIIVTPNHLHLAAARQAIARGIVPLVEKPISDDLDDAEKFADEAKLAGWQQPVDKQHHRDRETEFEQAGEDGASEIQREQALVRAIVGREAFQQISHKRQA